MKRASASKSTVSRTGARRMQRGTLLQNGLGAGKDGAAVFHARLALRHQPQRQRVELVLGLQHAGAERVGRVVEPAPAPPPAR